MQVLYYHFTCDQRYMPVFHTVLAECGTGLVIYEDSSRPNGVWAYPIVG